MKTLPATVLSGFPGAGRTILLNHIITNLDGMRVALIVNDVSEVNIDAALVRDGSADLSRTQDLDACLIDSDAFQPARWRRSKDPFPIWDRKAA